MFPMDSQPPPSPVRRWLVRIGIALLLPGFLLLLAAMLGLFASDIFALGGISGLRVLASISITGCLLAAIGYWDEE